MMMMRSGLRWRQVGTRGMSSVVQRHVSPPPPHHALAAVVSSTNERVSPWMLAMGLSTVIATSLAADDASAHCESVLADALIDDEPKHQRSRRNLLKSRTRHKQKLEEVDLMRIH